MEKTLAPRFEAIQQDGSKQTGQGFARWEGVKETLGSEILNVNELKMLVLLREHY